VFVDLLRRMIFWRFLKRTVAVEAGDEKYLL
jgi:hypothetical protein